MATPQNDHIRDHLANERTFLAWIRTSLATLGFGFVLARMGLFLREFPNLARHTDAKVLGRVEVGAEFVFTGALFLLVGTILALGAAWKYLRTRQAIQQDRFEPAGSSIIAMATLVFLCGVLIIVMILARGLLPEPVIDHHQPGAATPIE